MNIQNLARWLPLFAITIVLTGCASSHRLVNYSFGFNLTRDNQDAEVLDYRYEGTRVLSRSPEWLVSAGKPIYFEGIGGPMPRGESLYVKWRIRSTGQIYEDKVDLRHRLPTDITDHRVYFMIKGPQLYVYLISPERRAPGPPPIGPSAYAHLKIVTIYPDPVRP